MRRLSSTLRAMGCKNMMDFENLKTLQDHLDVVRDEVERKSKDVDLRDSLVEILKTFSVIYFCKGRDSILKQEISDYKNITKNKEAKNANAIEETT